MTRRERKLLEQIAAAVQAPTVEALTSRLRACEGEIQGFRDIVAYLERELSAERAALKRARAERKADNAAPPADVVAHVRRIAELEKDNADLRRLAHDRADAADASLPEDVAELRRQLRAERLNSAMWRQRAEGRRA